MIIKAQYLKVMPCIKRNAFRHQSWKQYLCFMSRCHLSSEFRWKCLVVFCAVCVMEFHGLHTNQVNLHCFFSLSFFFKLLVMVPFSQKSTKIYLHTHFCLYCISDWLHKPSASYQRFYTVAFSNIDLLYEHHIRNCFLKSALTICRHLLSSHFFTQHPKFVSTKSFQFFSSPLR